MRESVRNYFGWKRDAVCAILSLPIGSELRSSELVSGWVLTTFIVFRLGLGVGLDQLFDRGKVFRIGRVVGIDDLFG